MKSQNQHLENHVLEPILIRPSGDELGYQYGGPVDPTIFGIQKELYTGDFAGIGCWRVDGFVITKKELSKDEQEIEDKQMGLQGLELTAGQGVLISYIGYKDGTVGVEWSSPQSFFEKAIHDYSNVHTQDMILDPNAVDPTNKRGLKHKDGAILGLIMFAIDPEAVDLNGDPKVWRGGVDPITDPCVFSKYSIEFPGIGL